MLYFYLYPAMTDSKRIGLLERIAAVSHSVKDINCEYCFNIDSSRELSKEEYEKLCWLLSTCSTKSYFKDGLVTIAF